MENDNTNQIGLYTVIATDDAAVQQSISDIMKYYKSTGASTKKTSKKIGTMTRQVVTSISDDVIIYRYYQTHSSTKTYMEFVAAVDTETKTDLSGMVTFIEGITLKTSSSKPQVLNLPNVTISSKRGLGLSKFIDEDGLNICLLPKGDAYHLDLYAEQVTK